MNIFNSEEIILIADPRILSVPINDNYQEPIINLADNIYYEIAYGPPPEIPDNKDYTFVRKEVYLRLQKAQELLPEGLKLCLYEGYRSLNLQEYLFNTHFDMLKRHHPNWADEKIFSENTKLVSPVINRDGSKNIPPHSTGGAVDLYLIDKKGRYIDMGIHPRDWMQDQDGLLSLTKSQIISKEAKENRKIMSAVLEEVGFINYPTEYWHWSYGDRYWAYFTNSPYAIYDGYSKSH